MFNLEGGDRYEKCSEVNFGLARSAGTRPCTLFMRVFEEQAGSPKATVYDCGAYNDVDLQWVVRLRREEDMYPHLRLFCGSAWF